MISKNNVKEKLRNNEVVVGTFLKLADPTAAEILGYLNFDFGIIDNEHVSLNEETIAHIIRAARMAGMEAIVRTPSIEAKDISKVLDTGASGVQIPNVDTPDEVKKVIERAFYHPQGKRGFGPTNLAAGYGIIPPTEYARISNQETAVICHCETVEAVNNLEEMITFEEIDAFFVGPMDITQSAGHIGEPQNPDVQKVLQRAFDILREADKPFGTVASDGDGIKRCLDLGARYIVVSSDIGFLIRSAKELLCCTRK